MLPSFLRNYKATYVIENETNKVIYIASSRQELAGIVKTGISNISMYITKKILFGQTNYYKWPCI